ncbi:RND family efflux transporter MFP subunit [Lysinibacillus composti]|uniref:Efflux RND transporter periplasmic adaptor subunit n=1 Tax=Lysinibacillus composti TaxID=720633 RepID=A0A3N9UHE5_9BACI|nr:efflux RND transporter periplasmic adaptor subunit [Lysinibacillus composti]MBM7609082.1 RND family efflux transporter MFP subunit [Lysinibacillus composti]RQW75497.1 efflux RND transporter periplasmic adaptor subunit [Lysinibacillus composti]
MKKKEAILSIVISSALLMSACSSGATSASESESKSKRAAINVETASVELESLDALSSFSGKLEPVEETNVSYQIGGKIQDLKADVGDSIKSSEVLASLIDSDLQLQVDLADNAVLQAEATVISANSAISASEANIGAANARINSAQANLAQVDKGARAQEKEQAKINVDLAKSAHEKLKTDLERIKALYDQGIVAKSQYDEIKLQVDNAQKQVAIAEQSYSLITEGSTEEQRDIVRSGIKEAEAGKAQAQAAAKQSQASKKQAEASYQQALIGKKQAEVALAKTKLTSPTSGVILTKHVSEGEQINAGDPIYTVGKINQLKAILPIPDKEVANWKAGDEVTVRLYDEERKGKVSKIYPQTNEGTGTVSVEVVIDNEELDWLPGQVVSANRTVSDNVGILVPIEAVISSGSDPYVFKVVDGHAVKTAVVTGKLVGNKIHIVSGLEEGTEIVIRGGEGVLDGDPLKTSGGKEE